MNYDDWMMNVDETQSPQQQQAIIEDQKFMKKYFRFIRCFTSTIFFTIQITINYQSFHMVLIEYKPNLIITLFYVMLYTLIIRSFVLVTITDTKQLNSHVPQDEELQLNFCSSCQMYKLPNTYHCKICQVCILDRDHHCYYVGGCVGAMNYKFFISYCFLIHITSLCVLLTLYNQFYLAIHLFFRLILVYPLLIFFSLMSLVLLITHTFVLANDISQLSIKHQKEPFRYSLKFILKAICCCRLGDLFNIFKSIDETWKKRAGTWLSLLFP